MTVDLFDFKKTDFMDYIEFGGAATFFEFAGESDVSLFIWLFLSIKKVLHSTFFITENHLILT